VKNAYPAEIFTEAAASGYLPAELFATSFSVATIPFFYF
jgi:hypothetical protein